MYSPRSAVGICFANLGVMTRNVCRMMIWIALFALPAIADDHGFGSYRSNKRTAAETSATGAAADPCAPGRPGTGSSKPGAGVFAARCGKCHGKSVGPVKSSAEAIRRIMLDPLDPQYMPKDQSVLSGDEVAQLQAYFSN